VVFENACVLGVTGGVPPNAVLEGEGACPSKGLRVFRQEVEEIVQVIPRPRCLPAMPEALVAVLGSPTKLGLPV